MKTYDEVMDEMIAAKIKLANIVNHFDLTECPRCNNYHLPEDLCYICGYEEGKDSVDEKAT